MINEELLQQFHLRKYNPDYVPPIDFKVLTINNKIVGNLQSFIVFTGLPKTGKSTYLSALIASALHPADFFKMKINFPAGRRRIAYIDTESSSYDFYRQMERIRNFIGLNRLPVNLDAFAVREDNHIIIMQYIDAYLEQTPECSVLVIDGLLDLISNFNNETESGQLVQWLKKITKVYNILLITVIHLGKKDNQTLGHLGSSCDRYAQSTLLIEKDKDQQCFTLSSKFMRSDEDFEPITIKYFDGSYQEYFYQPTTETETKNKFKKK
jgi:hypothetical protein